jgi:alkyl sulfatase BDS1-like metallo-beta-lactamase superfamily hydrolase
MQPSPPYGAALTRGPHGQVGTGLGQMLSAGTLSLIPPTDVITTTGHEETVDGVRMLLPDGSGHRGARPPAAPDPAG